MTAGLSFIHRFEPGADPSAPAVLLLHGTGGDEEDLLPFGRLIAPGSPLLSPRGKVLENGMPRFFRRFREGAFDEDDVIARAAELAQFIVAARQAYGLPAPVAVGFSNGANIAAAVLMLHPDALAGAALIRAMAPLSAPPRAALHGKPILIVSGAQDPIVPAQSVARLAETLAASGAAVRREILPAGHGLTQADVTLARDFFETLRR